MIDITDRSHTPTLEEVGEYIGNSLLVELSDYLFKELGALYSIEYSGDNILLGWNVKFHKSGRALCRVYPKHNFFTVLVVVGKKEKERVEISLRDMSDEMQKIYESTKEGMGQRWLLIDLSKNDKLYEDVLKIASIRRNIK